MMHNWAKRKLWPATSERGLGAVGEVVRLEQVRTPTERGSPTLANHAWGLEAVGRYEDALAEYHWHKRANAPAKW